MTHWARKNKQTNKNSKCIKLSSRLQLIIISTILLIILPIICPAFTYWPCETEGKADRVGEAVRVGLRDLEGVGAEDGSHSPPIRAGRLWGDVGLIMLQTDPKESLALTLLLALQVSGAAVGIPSYPLLVEELLQLQLKHARAQNL